MPARVQTKKMCAKKYCANPQCPFPHPKPYQPTESSLKPLKKFVFHGAASICVEPLGEQFEDANTCQQVPRRTQHRQDQIKQCLRCDEDFVLTANESTFYIERKLHLPKRCKECRTARRNEAKDEADYE